MLQKLTVILGSLAFAVNAQKPEPFNIMADFKIPKSRFRTDPHPKWVNVNWEASEDNAFKPIRDEIERALSDPTAKDTTGIWGSKSRKAFSIWMADCQRPINLYRLSAYLGLTRMVDSSFEKSPDYSKMVGYANIGWMILRNPPKSYEFARRGYIFNAGDSDYHVYGDLPFKLLNRDPKDRAVVLAMVSEYQMRKPVDSFEQKLFRSLESISQTANWRPWDDFRWAQALRSYGRKHGKKESYDSAIKKAESAISKSPRGWDSSWITKWIQETSKEREDPNFGRLPGGKYVDDLDPP